MAVAATAFAAVIGTRLSGESRSLDSSTTFFSSTRFFVPRPNPGAVAQIERLRADGRTADAELLTRMIGTSSAIWFTAGTPESVERDVRASVGLAAQANAVPVLVAYNVPGRDCALYSAGGALTGDAYRAWIDGFAAGLGTAKAVVILEPDGIALLPTDCSQPDTYDRIGLVNYAAHALLRDPSAAVYLDAGNSGWHSTGDIVARLVAAGVADVRGFSQNVSNYQPTNEAITWGTWVSKCIWFGTRGSSSLRGRFDLCASQRSPARADDFTTWGRSDAWYDENVGAVAATDLAHFIVDTSRNGQGRWTPPAHPAGDAQDWCNPPGRGLGPRPTAVTGHALADAFLWLKIPGESDGQCYRWTAGPRDPVRNDSDPPAGMWFSDMALELARNASPPL